LRSEFSEPTAIEAFSPDKALISFDESLETPTMNEEALIVLVAVIAPSLLIRIRSMQSAVCAFDDLVENTKSPV
jgi:hypothetical protein